MSRHGRGSGPVPNRWMNCPRKASGLIMGKFMAFKTPLSENFDDKVKPSCRFPPQMLFESCRSKKINFGLWIDLTNTNRFYDKDVVQETGCKYIKLQCRGHGETPSEEQTSTFIQLVQNFISKNPLKHIAVHCTHGFNRTGFLIVSYIVKTMDCGLDIALEMFAKVRPPGIYKGDYIEELYRRFEDISDAPPPPPLPDWCFEDETGESGNAEPEGEPDFFEEESFDSGTSSASMKPNKNQKRKRHGKKAVFMKGVPGVEEFTLEPKASLLQKKVQQMCNWKMKGFPGSQPVSMAKSNIDLLHQKPYRVSWKADGMRYMMLIDGENEIYFFDRDHNIFRVSGLRFPHRKNLNQHLKDTLIDGEMVIDKVDGEAIPRYLAYDIIRFEKQDVGKLNFYPNRLQFIEYEIIKPRHNAMLEGIIKKTSEPFSIRNKQFWDISQAGSLLGVKFAASLSHEPDGLIFQPSKEPYVAGRCDEVLKWKPLDMNSVDFRLRIVKEEGVGIVPRKVCHLYVGQLDTPFDTMKFTQSLSPLDGKIIECKYENNRWQFMRERTDKSFPNSFNTAKAVCDSIKNPITKDYLLDYINRFKFEDDSEIMPPPNKKLRR